MRKMPDPRLRRLAWGLFILYLLFLVYVFFIIEVREDTYHNVNLVPLRTIRMFFTYYFEYHYFTLRDFIYNILGNVLLLVPFGFLLPLISRFKMNLLKVLLLAMQFSFLIEVVQLLTRTGETDIDDLILNVIGAAIGYLIVKISHPSLK